MIDFAELLNCDAAITQVTPVYQYYSAGEKISVYNRDDNGLLFASNCSMEYHGENGKSAKVNRGSIVLLPEGAAYTAEFVDSEGSVKENRISDYLIKFKLYKANFNADFPCVITENTNSKIRLIIDDIFSIESARNRLRLKSSFYSLLSNLIPKDDINDVLIQPAIDYLNSNPKFNLVSVNSLAKMCNMHPTTFRRHFEAAFGISPSQYIKDTFKEMAKYYLITEQRSVKEVVYRLGFSSASYFSRFYKENTGFSPSEIK